ncbi:MAG: hypothetical protein ACOZQL_24415 [Myxococcota bacterium]
MGFVEWFTEEGRDPGFKRAEAVSLVASGCCGLMLAGFWSGEPTTAVSVLVLGSLLAARLEGGGWFRETATWLVAGLSFSAALALLGAVVDRISVVHALPAILVHSLALYSVRVASRPILVGALMTLISSAVLLMPASRVARPPTLTITKSGGLLLDERPIEADTLTSRFRAGERVRLEFSEGPRARDRANQVLAELADAGVRIEL